MDHAHGVAREKAGERDLLWRLQGSKKQLATYLLCTQSPVLVIDVLYLFSGWEDLHISLKGLSKEE